jgi:hypothetical protein
MSHFTIIKTQLRDRDLLHQALRKMGFGTVELHDTPQPLYGYEGDARPEPAEVSFAVSLSANLVTILASKSRKMEVIARLFPILIETNTTSSGSAK